MKLIETSARSLYQVLELFLIISNGAAEVERFFKFLKAMKSKTRNRLGSEKARKMPGKCYENGRNMIGQKQKERQGKLQEKARNIVAKLMTMVR